MQNDKCNTLKQFKCKCNNNVNTNNDVNADESERTLMKKTQIIMKLILN